jgi:phosphohistidine phosphatase
MKRLTLLRHAKSGYGDRAERDFDRVLNARGERAALAIGRALRREGASFDRVLASDAARVAGTVAMVERGLGVSLGALWDRRLYLAAAQTLLDMVHAQPAEVDRLLMVAHNPGIEDLVLMLVPASDDDALRAAVYERLPTGSLVDLDFDITDWSEAKVARLTRFLRPSDLDADLVEEDD